MQIQQSILFLCDPGHSPHSFIELLKKKKYCIQTAELRSYKIDLDEMNQSGLILLCADSDLSRGSSFIDELILVNPFLNLPVVLLTNKNTNQSYIAECISKGVIDYINHHDQIEIAYNKVRNHIRLFTAEKKLINENQLVKFKNNVLDKKINSSDFNYRTIFYDSPFIIAIINRDLNLIEFNKHVIIGGISTKNLVGKHIREFPLKLWLKNNLNVENLLNSFFNDNITPKPKRAIIKTDTSEEHFEIYFSPFSDGDGNLHLQVIFKDITKYVKAELKARRNNLISDGLFDQAAVAVILISVNDWKVVKSNKKYDDTLRNLINTLFDGDISNLLLSDTLNLETVESIDKLLQGEIPKYTHDKCIRKSDTELIWIRITLSVLRLSDDNVTNLIGIIEDITDQKSAELLLNEINEVVSAKTGADYFNEVTAFLCRYFGVKYAFVGRFLEETDAIETISFRATNSEFENIVYPLKGTPCDQVIKGKECVFPQNVQKQFPDDKYLVDMNAESYLGIKLIDENGLPIGIMAILDTKVLSMVDEKLRVMNMLASRVSNEIKQRTFLRQLEEEQAFSKAILDSMDSNIAVIDSDGTIIETNKAWTDFSQNNGAVHTSQTGVGSNYFSVCEDAIQRGDEYAEQALQGIKSVINHEKSQFMMEYPCHGFDQKRWFIMSVTSFGADSDFTVIRHTNITQRKVNENKILESINQLRMIESINQLSLNNASQLEICSYVLSAYNSFIKIKGGRFYIYNEEQDILNLIAEERKDDKFFQLEKILGIKLNKVLPAIQKDGYFYRAINKKEIIHISDKNEIINVIKEHVENPLLKQLAGWSQIFLELSSFVMIPLVFNEKIFALITFSSNEKVNENDLEKIKGFNTQIISALAKSKTELEKTKLVNELTERYNELTQYSYIVSHNLRAPIAQILGLCQLLGIKGANLEDKLKTIGFIKNAAVNLDELVKELNEILAVKKTTNEKREYVNLNELFVSVFNTFEKQVKESKITIELKIEDDAKNIFTIKTYLKSVIYNLISNAIKHQSPDRKLAIHISARKINDILLISISDNGIGINLKEHGHLLFGLYKRINIKTEGKGLGLHMSKLQMEAMNGTIKVESELSRGSIFTLTLPFLTS